MIKITVMIMVMIIIIIHIITTIGKRSEKCVNDFEVSKSILRKRR